MPAAHTGSPAPPGWHIHMCHCKNVYLSQHCRRNIRVGLLHVESWTGQLKGNHLARNNLQQITHVHVSDQTVRYRLDEGGTMAWGPLVGPVLTDQHRVARLAFAWEHQNWQVPCSLHRWEQIHTELMWQTWRVWRQRGDHSGTCNIIQLFLQWVIDGMGGHVLGGSHRPPRVSQL